MFIWEILLSSLLAAILGMLLTLVLGRVGPGPLLGFIFFYVLIFLATWAGGLWLARIRPGEWQVNWLGYVLVSVLLWLMLAAVLPRQPRTPRSDASVPIVPPREAQTVAMGLLFWMVVVLLLAMIAVNYFAF